MSDNNGSKVAWLLSAFSSKRDGCTKTIYSRQNISHRNSARHYTSPLRLTKCGSHFTCLQEMATSFRQSHPHMSGFRSTSCLPTTKNWGELLFFAFSVFLSLSQSVQYVCLAMQFRAYMVAYFIRRKSRSSTRCHLFPGLELLIEVIASYTTNMRGFTH